MKNFIYSCILIMTLILGACSKVDSVSSVEAATPQSMSQQDLLEITKQNSNEFVILDVRSEDEFKQSHIKNAVNIPHTEILKDPSILEAYRGKKVVVHCERGGRASAVTDALPTGLFTGIYQLEGDMRAWRENKLPTEK